MIPESAIARTQRCLDGIAARNAEVNAFLQVLQEGALVQAEASDHRRKTDRLIGPLDGVIVALKDNMDLAGRPTSGGIGHYRASVAQADAAVVAQLKAAGAVIIGKTHMQEAALGASGENPWFGRCNNPLREGYSPGGSSSGSAAAVAAGWCELAMGSDTMGSVRIPAAYCGMAGFIASRGSLSLEGVMPLAPSLDQVGWIAASTPLLASAWQALGGAPPRIGARADLQGLRIGIATGFPAVPDSGPMQDLMERARAAAQGAAGAFVAIPALSGPRRWPQEAQGAIGRGPHCKGPNGAAGPHVPARGSALGAWPAGIRRPTVHRHSCPCPPSHATKQ